MPTPATISIRNQTGSQLTLSTVRRVIIDNNVLTQGIPISIISIQLGTRPAIAARQGRFVIGDTYLATATATEVTFTGNSSVVTFPARAAVAQPHSDSTPASLTLSGPSHNKNSPVNSLYTPMKTLASKSVSSLPRVSKPVAAIDSGNSGVEAILAYMRAKAAGIVGGALGQNLVPFSPTAQGNFKYYWQDPSNLQFNSGTYAWIDANLKAGATPVELDQSFSTLYGQVLPTVKFTLSTSDQAALVKAQQAATNQQMALLTAWSAAYGSIPAATATQQPIDIIMHTIATTWASPATNLLDIQQARNLRALLNNTPPSGMPILPVLANYLNALGDSASLQNAVTMNTGYLAAAVSALQAPSIANGGLALNNNSIQPAYAVNTRLSDILSGLGSTSNVITLTMTVARSAEDQVTISANGEAGFDIGIADFFSLGVSGDASYFSNAVATSSNTVSVSMTFPGVTGVSYGPVAFNQSGVNWYWTQPITEAIAHGSSDVTGFKFSPTPSVDFSKNGPFGFLSGVAICNFPSITITVTSSDSKAIAQTINQSASADISFLGISLGGGSESTYRHGAKAASDGLSVTITLTPPQQTVSGKAVDSSAWVLGVQTCYPADGAESWV